MFEFSLSRSGFFHIAQKARIGKVDTCSLAEIEEVNDDRNRQYRQGPEESWIQERHVDKTKEKWITGEVNYIDRLATVYAENRLQKAGAIFLLAVIGYLRKASRKKSFDKSQYFSRWLLTPFQAHGISQPR